MKSMTLVKPFTFLICIVLVFSCRKDEKAAGPNDSRQTVDVSLVSRLQPSSQVVMPGELKPWNKTLLYAKVKGFVGSLYVDRGDHVKQGQVLAVLEAPEVVAEYNQAKANVASASATVIETRTRQKLSKLTYQRVFETSKTEGAVSANELDLSYTQMLADSARASTAEENLRAAEAQVAAQAQLVGYLTVRAPFDGIITERNVSPGDLVGHGGNDLYLFSIEDISKLRLTIPVPEKLSNSIRKESVVSFSIPADPFQTYQAKFGRMANSVQEKNRTMMVEFDYDNTQGKLKAGMYAEVHIPVTRNQPTLFVYQDALIESTEGIFVVRANKDTAEWIPVERGKPVDSLVEVFGAIHEGDKIVRYASEELRNGQAIKVK